MILNQQGTGMIKKKKKVTIFPLYQVSNSKQAKNTQLEQPKRWGERVLRTSGTISSISTFLSWGFQKEKKEQRIKNLFQK